MFCWSKFGVESGERPDEILERKERERRANNGVFLWGVGNSIIPSVREAQAVAGRVEALFTPMLSRPAARDVDPDVIVEWRDAIGIDGRRFEIPAGSRVTSRLGGRGATPKHFALVCYSEDDLRGRGDGLAFGSSAVCNYMSGNRVGASQVTSVVRPIGNIFDGSGPYQVAFRATLAYPYVATLTNPVALTAAGERVDHVADWPSGVDRDLVEGGLALF